MATGTTNCLTVADYYLILPTATTNEAGYAGNLVVLSRMNPRRLKSAGDKERGRAGAVDAVGAASSTSPP